MSGIYRQPASAARRWRRIITGAAPLFIGLAAFDARGAQLFSQDFESLELGPFVSPSESNGDGTDWTATPPTGWVRDNGATTTGGPPEFFGFTFMDKGAWIATEGNQDRTTFTRGTGTVMVSDPDAYDDIGNIDPDTYNVFIQTPAIPLANVVASTATLNFDSSFRPYDGMTASVEVSFDGGTNFTNLLSMNSANVPGGDSSLARADEAMALDIDNPAGAANMILRFGMTNAGNDWWWAVDNISVSGDLVPEPTSTFVLLGAAGIGAMRRRRRSSH